MDPVLIECRGGPAKKTPCSNIEIPSVYSRKGSMQDGLYGHIDA